MGYTHYWDNSDLPSDKWNAFIKDVRKVIKKTDISIKGPAGTGKPIINAEKVSLNGDESKGEDYETFHLESEGTDFEFCKTEQNPYDDVVVAILCLAKEHFGDAINVRSDGDVEDWQAGLDLARSATSRGELPLTVEA